MAETYKFYPDGGRDNASPKRHDAQLLTRQGHAWRYVGSELTSRIPEDEMAKIRRTVKAGFGKIRKINEVGQIVEGGRSDLMKWTEGLEKGGKL